jgi:hypothetical protein
MPPAVFKKDFDATIATEATPTAQATTQTQTASTHKLHTEKHTTFLTVIIADDTLPAASLSPQNPAANSASVRDIIPISRSSPPPPPPTLSTKTMKTAFITAPRRSTYPRPSPPSFLYPEAILPQSAYTYQRKMQHPALPGSNVIGYLPFGLEAVVGLVLLLGLVWAGFRWCVMSPARRWSGKKKERRPLDKPSRYVASPRKHEEVPTIHLHENTNIDAATSPPPLVRTIDTEHAVTRTIFPAQPFPPSTKSQCAETRVEAPHFIRIHCATHHFLRITCPFTIRVWFRAVQQQLG